MMTRTVAIKRASPSRCCAGCPRGSKGIAHLARYHPRNNRVELGFTTGFSDLRCRCRLA
jgi:hypothetical protein